MINQLKLNTFLPTGVGSLPHTNPEEACDLVFKYLSNGVPYWPQLPKRSFKENMYVQYSRGLPGVVLDENKRKVYIDTLRDSYSRELEETYQHYLSGNTDYFALGESYAAGFYKFIGRQEELRHCRFVKGQVIGPVSFGLSVTDQDRKAVIYNNEFCECLTKALALNASWQINELSKALNNAGNKEAGVIIFIDEPYLVSVGSSFFNIGKEEVAGMINEICAYIHKCSAYAGLHCCGNTDWPLILKTDIDILSFDSYNYMASLFLYRNELGGFLERGGKIAWGIIPTDPLAELPEEGALLEKLKEYPIGKNGFITPSCGLGGLSCESSESMLHLAAKIAARLP